MKDNDSLSPTDLRTPWFLRCSVELPAIQTFYNMEESCYYVKEIEDIYERSICATFHEWAVVHDNESPNCFLFNIDSMEKIDLPPLELDCFRFCFLSSSPDDDNCIVAFIIHNRIRYCHPGEGEWMEHEFEDAIYSLAISKDKIYVLQGLDNLLEMKFISGEVELKNLAPGLSYPGPSMLFPERYVMFKIYLVESRENIFLVVFSYAKEEPWRNGGLIINVYMFDDCNSNWVATESLGDQTFFINGDTSSISWSATRGTNLMANSIYFMLDGDRRIMNVFDIKERHIYPLLPLSEAGCRWVLMRKTMAGLRPK